MRRIALMLVFAALAPAAHAGLSYKVVSVTTGLRQVTFSGTAQVEGVNTRLSVDHGDGMLFPDHSFVVSQNGGRTFAVVDPASKTYYELRIDELAGSIGSALHQLGGMLAFKIDDPKVSVSSLGSGGLIEKYPTERTVVDSSYNVTVDAMGQKMVMTVAMKVESWTTDRISGGAASFLQTQSFHSGVDAVDKLISAQAGAVKGFPLKQVSTTRITQNGSTMESVTTTRISDIATRNVAATQFEIPAGFTKGPSPIETALKALSGAQH